MSVGVYPGSFDPVTNGHLDIIRRSRKLFDKLIVAVVYNVNKQGTFSLEKRKEFIERLIQDMPNVEVKICKGLLVDFVANNKATTIVRGLRAITDFEYELQMAQTNSKISCNEMETIFMATKLEFAYISSSIAKEVGKFGGDISSFIPHEILDDVKKGLKGV